MIELVIEMCAAKGKVLKSRLMQNLSNFLVYLGRIRSLHYSKQLLLQRSTYLFFAIYEHSVDCLIA